MNKEVEQHGPHDPFYFPSGPQGYTSFGDVVRRKALQSPNTSFFTANDLATTSVKLIEEYEKKLRKKGVPKDKIQELVTGMQLQMLDEIS